jgi:hypothetical protein
MREARINANLVAVLAIAAARFRRSRVLGLQVLTWSTAPIGQQV